MATLLRAARVLLGFFVDDGFLAASAVAWVAAAVLILPHLVADDGVRGLVLFAGLAGLLAASTLRRAMHPRA